MGLAGEQLEARLGGSVLDYLTDAMVCSIYSVLERWPVNLMETRGGRRGKGSLVQELHVFHRGGLTGDHRVCIT